MKKINPLARYYETNEWIKKENSSENIFTIGITDFAQTVFGNVISIELPEVGNSILKSNKIVVIESDKVSTEIESPISGIIISINTGLHKNPSWLNESPYEKGWIAKIKISNQSEWDELMTAKAYQEYMNIFYNKKKP